MSYGSAITPAIYYNNEPRLMTKSQLARELWRALKKVGMVHIPSFTSCPFDIELVGSEDNAAWSAAIDTTRWFFDYPTTDTFAIGANTYRPIVGIYFPWRTYNAGTYIGHTMGIMHCRRRSDRLLLTDVTNLNTIAGYTAYNGFGLYSTGANYWYDKGYVEGAYYTEKYWKPRPSHATTELTLVPVRYILVALTKAGLLIQVGQQDDYDNRGTYLSYLFAFGLDRIPGRARNPLTDPDLGKCDPVLALPLKCTAAGTYPMYVATDYVSRVAPRHRANQLGFTYTYTGGVDEADSSICRASLFNATNADFLLYNLHCAQVQDSPRRVLGVPAHVLEGIFVVPETLEEGGYSGKIVTGYSAIRGTPPPQGYQVIDWRDAYWLPHVRYADPFAPLGSHVDSVSGKTWWLFPWDNVGQRGAIDISGATWYLSL
jgi:hypothetical protein